MNHKSTATPTNPSELFVGMTPAQWKQSTDNRTIHYGIHQSPFGPFLLGINGQHRICILHFLDEKQEISPAFQFPWNEAIPHHHPEITGEIAGRLFVPTTRADAPLLAAGTSFQLKVWEYLLSVPFGERVTYRQVAEGVGSPGAFQAVGNAVGNNHIAYLIPCHRVVRKDGKPTRYRWGDRLKEEILRWESHP
ncbi:MAG: methylated-DNA--[protein]-cysteine S-methyltransferase [Bacteroidales bacterium]